MANISPTIVAAALSDQDLKNSIDKLVNYVDKKTMEMAQNFDAGVELMKESLKKLGNVKIDFGGTSSGGGTKKAIDDQKSLEEQTKKTTQAVKEQNLTLDQQSSAQKNAVNSAKKYSEEVIKQAQAIREMKQFQEKGYAMVGDRVYYDPSRSVAPLKNRLSLEEQILRTQKEEEIETIRRISAEKQEAIEKAAAAQAAQAQLGTEKQITQEVEKRSSKKNTFSTYDDLRQAIASVLGLQKQQVKVIDEEYASYNKLHSALTQYRQAFNALSASERSSENGKNLLRRIHELERALQKLQKEASRPISLKDALKGSESTLDAIAYKMQRLQSYRKSIDLTKDDAADKIKQVDDKLRQLQSDADKWMGKQRGMIDGNNALGRSWNYMKNRLAFYFTVGATTQFIKQLIDVRGQYELLERSIGILIDSAQNGSKIFAELNSMAIKSPFTTMELGAAAKQLVAYDVAAKDVVDTTRRLADMAAAVGIPIERLTYALGQIKAYGYLNARDARMFANAGIPLVKELADRYTELEGRLVSTSDVYDRIKKKAISYEDVMETVNKMTDEGGKFFNFQEKAADTLKVKIANLTLAWNNMLNEIGKDNQGVLAGMLNLTKQIFESWRDINNMLVAIAVNFGVIKAIQISRLLLLQKEITWTRTLVILQNTLGKGAMNFAALLGKGVTALANPITLAIAAATALSVVITKLTFDYSDLQKANDAFNKSIVDSAEENIKSIDKFFEDYKKQLEGIGGASTIDQQKMWEKIQDEIEKTTKNAQQYIAELEKIQNIADRIDVGKKILEQEQEIEQEAKRLAEKGIFDLGGGFADDSLADNLINYEKELKNIRNEYGNVTVAVQEHSLKSRKMMADYTTQLQESERELSNFTSKLDEADITRIMGDDPSTQLANLREFTNIIRDNFLATERGQKITADGQARLNSSLDKWVAKQAQANDLIKNQTVYSIEENRTAWETFFDQLNRKDRERLDYLIKTNQTGSDDFKEIWDKATKSMAERATTSYELIQSQIANLKNTPDIVINVVYKERTQKVTDKQIQAYKEKYLTPDNSYTKEGIVGADVYAQEQEILTRKYGRYIKKEGEDNVDWEKRLGQEYQNNTKNIKSLSDQIDNLNKQKEKGVKISEVDIQAKKDEKSALEENNKTLLEIGKNEGFNYEQFEKGRKGGSSKKDLVLEALKQEISLVERLQGDYDKLTKSGASRDEALKTIRDSFGKTINSLNAKLSSAGLPELTTQLFIGKDPNKMLEHFKQTLNTLVSKGMMTLERSKEVEAVIEKLTVSAKTYNLDKITKGLNNELGRLKDEYELAVELDANPELGNMFADMFDIDLDTLPRTAKEYADRYTKSLNKYFNQMGANIELPNMLNLTRNDMEAFTEQLGTGELQQAYFDLIQKGYEATQAARKKEATDAIKEYDKLLQKYAEYQYKLTQIAKDANNERKALVVKLGTEEQKESARKIYAQLEVEDDPQKAEELKKQLKALVDQVVGDDQVRIQLKVAIDNKEAQESAKASFEEFQKNPIWTTAIGDLEGMTHRALRLLINDLEDFKKANKDLSPKQIKEIERTITKLRKQSRKNNPFYVLANAISDAKERADEFQPRINEIEKEIDRLTTGMDSSNLGKIAELREELAKLKEIQGEEGEIDWEKFVGEINAALQIAKQATGYFTDMMDALGGKKGSLASKRITEIFGVLEKAGAGAAMGAQIGSGWGAAIGAVVGGLSGAITTWADEWSGNASITRAIESSVKAAKDLENTYKRLTYVAEDFYGASSIASKEAAKNVKILELAELQRQLRLEESRASKNRDQDRINEIRSQIIDLEHEVANATKQTVSDLLGISSHADFFEGLISDMISAFKNGEDAMDVFENKWAEMIDSMVTKMILGQVLQQWIKSLESGAEGIVGKYTADYATQIADLESKLESVESMSNHDFLDYIMENEPELYRQFLARYGMTPDSDWMMILNRWMAHGEELREEYLKLLKSNVDSYTDEQQRASLDATSELMDYYEQAGEEFKEKYLDAIVDKISENYTFGEGAESKLSALQQGIQGITEDTAGAIESYLNIISQRIFIHTDLITEIRDAVVGMTGGDLGTGIQAQMLFRMQQSYTVQMAIQNILENAVSPNGQSFRVELVS